MDFGILRLSFVAKLALLIYELDFWGNEKSHAENQILSVTRNGRYITRSLYRVTGKYALKPIYLSVTQLSVFFVLFRLISLIWSLTLYMRLVILLTGLNLGCIYGV